MAPRSPTTVSARLRGNHRSFPKALRTLAEPNLIAMSIRYRDERRPRLLPVKEVLGRNAPCGIAEAVAAPILN